MSVKQMDTPRTLDATSLCQLIGHDFQVSQRERSRPSLASP